MDTVQLSISSDSSERPKSPPWDLEGRGWGLAALTSSSEGGQPARVVQSEPQRSIWGPGEVEPGRTLRQDSPGQGTWLTERDDWAGNQLRPTPELTMHAVFSVFSQGYRSWAFCPEPLLAWCLVGSSPAPDVLNKVPSRIRINLKGKTGSTPQGGCCREEELMACGAGAEGLGGIEAQSEGQLLPLPGVFDFLRPLEEPPRCPEPLRQICIHG